VTAEQIEKRKRVMERSMALGHCICDPRQPCPCPDFRDEGYCHCAGERPKVADGPVKLTEHVRNAGCASKISKGMLREVLAGLPEIDDPRVVVGASAGDDAGVMMLSKDTATILTVDVFCPAVDDPYTFGQIAAANSISDIYAMGGTPQAALSIIGFPVHSLPLGAMREILRGGLDKMKEAGVPVVGGHSINDEEVKCGFAVIGTSPHDEYVRNAGARAGDVMVLTKPLGGGIVAFAHQLGRAPAGAMDAVALAMATLNRDAGRLMVKHSAHAATDVTGFSLMGHLCEIVRNSQVEVIIDFDAVPVFAGAMELAKQDVIPGAVERNRESVNAQMVDLRLSPAQEAILYCPETSGGMLVFLTPRDAEAFVRGMQSAGQQAWVIGQVTCENAAGRICARAEGRGENYMQKTENSREQTMCCADVPAQTVVTCCADGQGQPDETAKRISQGENPLPAPAGGDAYKAYMSAVSSAGAIDLKNKKLMALSLSVMGKCEPCVKINAKAARDAGATEAQIAEAAAMAIAFGGSTVAMFYNTLRGK
jgi:selenide, water dikinase